MYSKSAARITSGITKCNHMPLFGERASMGESVLHDWMDLGIGYVELWNCFFFFWWCDHLVTRLQDKPKLRLYGYIASDSLSFWEQQLVTAFAYTHNCVTFFHSLSKQCNGSEAGNVMYKTVFLLDGFSYKPVNQLVLINLFLNLRTTHLFCCIDVFPEGLIFYALLLQP